MKEYAKIKQEITRLNPKDPNFNKTIVFHTLEAYNKLERIDSNMPYLSFFIR